MPPRLRYMINIHVRTNLNGKELVIPANLESALENLSWTKSWKTEIIEALIDTNDVLFIDVGANVGQTLLDLHLTQPKTSYLGFEPNVVCVNYLNELIQKNSIQNYKIVPVGLAAESKCMQFFRHKDSPTDTCGSIISDLRPERSFDTDIVPCFRFDQIRQEIALGKIGFVKIDVEGAELETLIGMERSIREYRSIILCEVLFTDSKAELSTTKSRNNKLMELLSSMQYAVLQLIKSPDVKHIIDVKKVQEFPTAYYTSENAELCDYLFIPEENEEQIVSSLITTR